MFLYDNLKPCLSVWDTINTAHWFDNFGIVFKGLSGKKPIQIWLDRMNIVEIGGYFSFLNVMCNDLLMESCYFGFEDIVLTNCTVKNVIPITSFRMFVIINVGFCPLCP